MPARTPVAKRFEIFDETVAGMNARLKRMREPHQLFAALQWGMDELEHVYAETAAGVLRTVACRSGCDACCHVPVDVQAHEVLFVANHIQTNFSPQALLDVIARLAAHRYRVAALAPGTRDHSRQACALLVDGACSVYAGRPEACRSHHSNDAAICAAHIADPSVDVSKAYIPALRARMFAVMLGVDQAIESAGYDDRSYDFGSALHEALTNILCLSAWLRYQSAFPDSCLADAD